MAFCSTKNTKIVHFVQTLLNYATLSSTNTVNFLPRVRSGSTAKFLVQVLPDSAQTVTANSVTY